VAKRSKVRLVAHEVMTVHRGIADSQKFVYLLIADRAHKYSNGGRSRIAYIGTTKRGEKRAAASAADKAARILADRGVRSFSVRIVTCRPRRRTRMWENLEKALLYTFEDMYRRLPRYNKQRGYRTEKDAYRYFRRDRLRAILQKLAV
jgi:hypothetical protein